MESSEIFLMAWAIIATIFAVIFNHRNRRLELQLIIHQLSIRMIGEGKAKVVIENDRIKVMEV